MLTNVRLWHEPDQSGLSGDVRSLGQTGVRRETGKE
jgi:hypothetical protein